MTASAYRMNQEDTQVFRHVEYSAPEPRVNNRILMNEVDTEHSCRQLVDPRFIADLKLFKEDKKREGTN